MRNYQQMPIKIIILSLIVFGSAPKVIGQWVEANGPYGAGITCISKHNNIVYVGTSDGIYITADSGNSWVSSDSGITTKFINFVGESGANLYAGTSHGIYISTDKGVHWKFQAVGLVSPSVNSFASLGSTLFAGTSEGLYNSSDGGKNWILSTNIMKGASVVGLAENGMHLFAGTSSHGVFLSNDTGKTWSSLNNQLYDTNVVSLVYTGKYLFCGTGSTAFQSTDNGSTWTWDANLLTGGLGHINGFVMVGDTIFSASLGKGVQLSTDNGQNWNIANGNISDVSISALSVDGNIVIAGTTSGAMWFRGISDYVTSSVSQTHFLDHGVRCFPNPFSRSLKVSFSTFDRAFTRIAIVNLLGSEVGQLFSGELEIGEHSFNWDSKEIPAGMYLCIVRSGNQVTEIPLTRVN
jgi:hypothetical protein